ncbi:hypothetical protein I600_3112 [Maribacter dokdonensis DSW-8]|nr:hypothetical protein I600_3112 [Maribacter dokdonensis DSW-8]
MYGFRLVSNFTSLCGNMCEFTFMKYKVDLWELQKVFMEKHKGYM